MPSKKGSGTSQPTDNGFALDVGGRTLVLRLQDFTGLDARLVRQATGIGLAEIFATAAVDLDTMAALVWRHRARTEPNLTYEEVAAEFTFADFETVRDATDDEGDDDPEA